MNTKLVQALAMASLMNAEPGAAGGAVPTSNVSGAASGTEKKEPVKAEIVRGVMPVALVAHIKFNTDAGAKPAEVAKLYGTTSGKVVDILKGRNFGYLNKDFKATKEQTDAAVAWMKKVPGYGEAQDKIIVALEKAPVASEAEAKAFLDTRAASRTRTAKTDAPAASSETSAGNGKAKGKDKGEAKADPKAAADLLK